MFHQMNTKVSVPNLRDYSANLKIVRGNFAETEHLARYLQYGIYEESV